MMLRYSFDMNTEADRIERAVDEVLKAGFRTGDIYTDGTNLISGSKMLSEIITRL